MAFFALPSPQLARNAASLEVRFDAPRPQPLPDTESVPPQSRESGVIGELPSPPETAPDGPVDVLAEYFKPSQLSAPPMVLTLGSLNSQAPDTKGISGKVIFEILINERGKAVAVSPLFSTVPEAYRDYAAGVLLEARYRPGELFGNPARSRVKIEIEIADGKVLN